VRRRSAALCGLAAVAIAVATPLLGGAARPGYAHTSQFISELGERGAEYGGLVSALGFAPTGLLVLLFLAFAAPAFPRSWRTAIGLLGFAAVGVAYLVASIARCDAGCPSKGSTAQTVHNLFGALEYIGAFAGLLLLASAFATAPAWRSLAAATRVCAIAVGAGFALAVVPSLAPLRGISQRLAEAGIFLWIALVATALLRTQDGRQPS